MVENLLDNEIIPNNNYDNHSDKYKELTESDPSKKWVQYPESMRMVLEQFGGELKGKRIMDIGCANGTFTRMMAREGADVVGYDPSEKEVQEAQQTESKEPLGIKYIVSDRPAIDPNYKFDGVTAILVLSLMEDKEQFEQIFKYAGESLKPGGKFIILTINPKYNREDIVYNRRFNKIGKGNKYTLDFFDNEKKLKFSINGSQFSEEEHRQAAINAGFKDVEWKSLKINSEGIKEQGKEFWAGYEENCPYIGMVAYK
ncbi:MAG: methyltransferase domain-containing protein [bacterium]